MIVQFGKCSDIDGWMSLVEEISWNFPGLETREKIDGHRQTVLHFISKEQALCAKNDNCAQKMIIKKSLACFCFHEVTT